MARLYREAPVNSIWEGSGNVMCLDVMRAIAREPEAASLLLDELADAGSDDAPLPARWSACAACSHAAGGARRHRPAPRAATRPRHAGGTAAQDGAPGGGRRVHRDPPRRGGLGARGRRARRAPPRRRGAAGTRAAGDLNTATGRRDAASAAPGRTHERMPAWPAFLSHDGALRLLLHAGPGTRAFSVGTLDRPTTEFAKCPAGFTSPSQPSSAPSASWPAARSRPRRRRCAVPAISSRSPGRACRRPPRTREARPLGPFPPALRRPSRNERRKRSRPCGRASWFPPVTEARPPAPDRPGESGKMRSCRRPPTP